MPQPDSVRLPRVSDTMTVSPEGRIQDEPTMERLRNKPEVRQRVKARELGLSDVEDRGEDSVYVQYRDQLKTKDPAERLRLWDEAQRQGVDVGSSLWRALKDEATEAAPPPPSESEAERAEAKATSKSVAKELRETAAKAKAELKALGKKSSDALKDVNTVYQDQMTKIGSEAGQLSADAYVRMNTAMDKMDDYATRIQKLMEGGAADSPFVERQIAAYNGQVDAAAEQARSDLSRKMAARGAGASNEQIYLEGKLEVDVARSKATGAADIESRFVQFSVGVLEFQSQLAFSEAQYFGNQFEKWSGTKIGIETGAAQAGAELGVKAVGVETGLEQAGIAAEAEFTKTAGGVEVGGAQFAAQMAASSDALKESIRQFDKTFQFETEVKFPSQIEMQRLDRDMQRDIAKMQADTALWQGIFEVLATGGGVATGIALA